MDYDYRNRTAPGYRPPPGGAGSSFYPSGGQPSQQQGFSPAGRAPYRAAPAPPSSGLGIRVAIKPEYRISPPPPLAPQMAEVPRSTFLFDFDFEKKILAEAEQESQNWSRFAADNPPSDSQNWSRIAADNPPSKNAASSSTGPVGDPVVNKYVASGLGREAVSLAVLNYGDNPTKVREFVKGYNLLREMGFSSKNVAESLAMYDNDTDKALAHFLNSSS